MNNPVFKVGDRVKVIEEDPAWSNHMYYGLEGLVEEVESYTDDYEDDDGNLVEGPWYHEYRVRISSPGKYSDKVLHFLEDALILAQRKKSGFSKFIQEKGL